MLTQYSQLFQLFDDVASFVNEHSELKDGFALVAKDFEARRNQQAPSIIIYGVYNAGKSTLINALLGRDAALVADIPTTDSIDEYTWTYQNQNYILTDTPGIDAPKEHEIITREKLNSADGVIFVVNPEGIADEIKTLEQVVKLLAAHKRLMLVLNSKKPLPKADQENYLLGLHNKMLSRLQEIASEQHLEINLNDLPIVDVNAKTAFAASQHPKPQARETLNKASNIEQCKQLISKLFQDMDEAVICERLSHKLQEYLKQQLQNCQAQQSQNSNCDEQYYQALLQSFDQKVAQCKFEVNSAISKAGATLNRETQNIFMRATQSDVTSELSNLQERLENNVFAIFQRYCVEINRDLETHKLNIAEQMQHDPVQVAIAPEENDPLNGYGIQPLLLNSGSSIERINPETIAKTSATITAAAEALAPMIGIRIASWLPYVGLVVTAAATLYSIFKGDSQEDAMRRQVADHNNQVAEARMRFEKQVADQATSLQFQFEENLKKFFAEQYDQFDDIRKMFTDDMQKNTAINHELALKVTCLNNFMSKLG